MIAIDYRQAGVDITAGNEVVSRIKDGVQSTYGAHVLTPLGGFAGILDLKSLIMGYEHPVLVQSIDGVGTKVKLAKDAEFFDNLGEDLLSAACNDIVVVGAKPITMLDYIANEKLNVDIVERIVNGLARACRDHDIALLGGETAEMPGVYQQGEIDIAGAVTGVAEKGKLITGQKIKPGDVILGLASNGLHTNGFSLVRYLIDRFGISISKSDDFLQKTPAEALLAAHRNYTKPILSALNAGFSISGMAHITGGGLLENIPRVLPRNTKAILDMGFPKPRIFAWISRLGEVEPKEMLRTFNMGIGFVVIVDKAASHELHRYLCDLGETVYPIGEIVAGFEKPCVEFLAGAYV